MSKRKSNNARIFNLVLIVLAIGTLVSLFLANITVTGQILGAKATDLIKGTDAFAVAFQGKDAETSTEGISYLVGLLHNEDYSFLTTVFCWSYVVMAIGAAACLVFAILNLLNIKLNLFHKICAVVLGVCALVTFVSGIIVSTYFNGDVLGIASSKGGMGIGLFLVLLGIVYAAVYFVKSSKK